MAPAPARTPNSLRSDGKLTAAPPVAMRSNGLTAAITAARAAEGMAITPAGCQSPSGPTGVTAAQNRRAPWTANTATSSAFSQRATSLGIRATRKRWTVNVRFNLGPTLQCAR